MGFLCGECRQSRRPCRQSFKRLVCAASERRVHRARGFDRLRRSALSGGAQRRCGRSRNDNAFPRGRLFRAGRRIFARHRRAGYEMPSHERRRHRFHSIERSLFFRLRQLSRQFCAHDGYGCARVQQKSAARRKARRLGKPVYRIYEQPRQTGAKRRRVRRRHLRGSFVFGY